MKRARTKTAEEEGCFDLVERAVHLLRQAPLSTLSVFYVGAIPFVMGLLFFLADMSASPFAATRCAGGAFGLALLYVWMRVWQSVFCGLLYNQAAQRESDPLSVSKMFRRAYFQLTRSAWGLFVLPLAALVMIPFGWVYAYFQNLCIVDPTSASMAESVDKARALSKPWPKQNHYVIAILYGFGYLVFFNIISVLVQAPMLLKSLGGIESEFTLSYHWIGNSTFIAVVCGLTYLVVEPFIKSAYVLRFHASESITTGEDLLADLKRIPPRRRAAGVVRIGLFFLLAFGALSTHADDPAPHTIDIQELDVTVDRVMQEREFTWRMPKEYAPEADGEKGFFATFIESVANGLKSFLRGVGEMLERFFEWLGDRFSEQDSRENKSSGLDPSFFKGLSVFALVILSVVLLIFLVKAFLVRRQPPPKLEEAKAFSVKVDLEDENVIATLLAEDEWVALARELAAQGDLRKATRAWFLAGLAYLSRMDMLSILQSKSNLDYQDELTRRARRNPEVIPVFSDNIARFERAWYGLHSATVSELQQLELNLERMRHGFEA